MSTTVTTGKRSLAVACKESIDFRALFPADTYERWETAGSVRRQVDAVGDVEHVVIARIGEVPVGDGGLFGERAPGSLLWQRLEQLVRDGVLAKHMYGDTGPRWGPKYRGVDFPARGAGGAFLHELFTANVDNWGVILAIRTGPSDFSRMLVTRMRERGYQNRDGYVWNVRDWSCTCGWVGNTVEYVKTEVAPASISPQGERFTEHRLKGGWNEKLADETEMTATCLNCHRHEGVRPARVSVPDEKQYFEICGVPWREPASRR